MSAFINSMMLNNRAMITATTPAPRHVAHRSRLAVAIAGAAKKSMIEVGIEASAAALLECQRARSVVLTTSFMRSDSQQAHCYRF